MLSLIIALSCLCCQDLFLVLVRVPLEDEILSKSELFFIQNNSKLLGIATEPNMRMCCASKPWYQWQ